MTDENPKNRKERRAAARESGKPIAPPTSTPKFKLQQPDRSAPKSKTLMDLYEEKKALLEQGQPFDKKYEDGLVRDEGGNILEAGLGDGEPIGPVGNAIFWAFSLAIVHFTLDVLVFNQYRQEIEWGEIFQRSLIVLPALFLLLFTMASETASRFPLLKQIFFFAVGVGAGCYVIYAANKYSYYAVMKRAPPLGTLWIWSVIEMNLPFAAVSLVVNFGFLWYNGYSAF